MNVKNYKISKIKENNYPAYTIKQKIPTTAPINFVGVLSENFFFKRFWLFKSNLPFKQN